MRKPCSYPGCDRQSVARGYCDTHYRQYRKHGLVWPILEHTRGANNGWWAGDEIKGYGSMHSRLTCLLGPASLYVCIRCDDAATQWAYDHNDPEERRDERGTYSIDIDHYEPMCHRCHMRFDRGGQVDGCQATGQLAGIGS